MLTFRYSGFDELCRDFDESSGAAEHIRWRFSAKIVNDF